MRYSALAGAALVGLASAAKDKRTFAVMRFNGDPIFRGNVDPIVNPGEASTHEHTVFGGSNFAVDATGASMAKSDCTSAKIKGDKSAYWVPTVYFHDEKAGTFEPVPVHYTNIYYFFEPTDDEKIEAFPLGLSMLAGDVNLRTPIAAAENLNPAKPINNAIWTCPRTNLDRPGWPLDSDGTKCGMQDPNNKGQGVGFPTAECDGFASPLRADIHFPSCYNPDKDVTDYKNNMAWPEFVGGKQNCPPGYKHVPHIFMEVYWKTTDFSGRWTPGGEHQPFVLSNGDVTGYSLHADFLSGWDEQLLQNIIDEDCNVGHAGMELCRRKDGGEIPGLEINKDTCQCKGSVTSMATKSSGAMTSLPGNCPLSGFKYGDAPAMQHGNTPVAQKAGAKPVEEVEQPEEVEEQEEEQSSPEVPAPDSPAVEAPAPTPEITKSEPLCVTRTKTVMETVTVYADEIAAQNKRRHLHRHHARHYRS